jgi:hypothetical protein
MYLLKTVRKVTFWKNSIKNAARMPCTLLYYFIYLFYLDCHKERFRWETRLWELPYPAFPHNKVVCD